MIIPLIMIENGTRVEFRDCGLKSIKMFGSLDDDQDDEGSVSYEIHSKNMMLFKKKVTKRSTVNLAGYVQPSDEDNEGKEEGDSYEEILEEEQEIYEGVHEICFWMNGDSMFEKNLLEEESFEYNS